MPTAEPIVEADHGFRTPERKENDMTTTGLQLLAFTVMATVVYCVVHWSRRGRRDQSQAERSALLTWEAEGGNVAEEGRRVDPAPSDAQPT